jgi:hypothetical protein
MHTAVLAAQRGRSEACQIVCGKKSCLSAGKQYGYKVAAEASQAMKVLHSS